MRRRSGYRALDSEDIVNHTTLVDEVDTAAQDIADELDCVHERELVQQEAWIDLIYSFLASGVMTVSSDSSACV